MAEAEKVILSRDAFPGNSAKSKRKGTGEEVEPRQKREAVASAKRVKKTFGQRFKSIFQDGGVGSEILEYIVQDVMIPTAKTAFADVVEGAIDRALFGGDRRAGSRSRRDGGRPYASYNSMYQGGGRREERGARERPTRHDFTGVILENRSEADHVLDEMALVIEQYNVVSVGELYELVGITPEFTDQNFGWTDLGTASVRRVRDGWTLDLPRPRVID